MRWGGWQSAASTSCAQEKWVLKSLTKSFLFVSQTYL